VDSAPQPRGRDRSTVIGDGLTSLARWSLRLALIAVGVVLLARVISMLWSVLLPITMALLLTSLLHPLVDWLAARKVPRSLAAAGVVIGFLLVMVGVVAALTSSVVSQVGDVADGAVAGLERIRDWVTGPPLELSSSQVDQAIDAISSRLQDAASTIASGVFSGVSAVGSVLVTSVLVIVLAFFFVKDGHRFLPWLRTYAGERAGRHVAEVLSRWWFVLGAYVRTQLLVSLVDAVLIGAGLFLLGVPLALTLATLTFFGGFIPIVGAFVAGGVAILVALVTEGGTTALLVLGLVLLVQQLEGNVLSPWLQGRSLQLHAGVVLLAVTGGGSRYGIMGAFLAVPVTACVVVLMRYISEQVDEASAPAIEVPTDSHPQPASPLAPQPASPRSDDLPGPEVTP
jgi:predicted PurR-regulated permease PerM